MSTTIQIPDEREARFLLRGTFERDTYELQIHVQLDDANAADATSAEHFVVNWLNVKLGEDTIIAPLVGPFQRKHDDEVRAAANRYATRAINFVSQALDRGSVERLSLEGWLVTQMQFALHLRTRRTELDREPETSLRLFEIAALEELTTIMFDEFGDSAGDYTTATIFLANVARWELGREWSIGSDEDQRVERKVHEILAETGVACGAYAERALEVIRAGYVLGDSVSEMIRRAYHDDADVLRPWNPLSELLASRDW